MQRISDLEIADLHDVVVLPGAVEALASLARREERDRNIVYGAAGASADRGGAAGATLGARDRG